MSPLLTKSLTSQRALCARPALAILDIAEFERARSALPAFARFEKYDDFLDEVEGAQIGLAAAGAPAELAFVTIAGFLAWSENFATQRDLADLHAFAADVLKYREKARWHAVLCASPRRGVDDTGDKMPLRRRLFDTWRRCVGAADDQDGLCRYAGLIVELWRAEPD